MSIHLSDFNKCLSFIVYRSFMPNICNHIGRFYTLEFFAIYAEILQRVDWFWQNEFCQIRYKPKLYKCFHILGNELPTFGIKAFISDASSGAYREST